MKPKISQAWILLFFDLRITIEIFWFVLSNLDSFWLQNKID